MRACVVVFPGTNRERDIAAPLAAATGRPPEMVWHQETSLPDCDLVVLPGGFSYGDYLRSGAMAVHSPIMRSVVAAANKGTLVLGICNGFQVLTESGLLPGVLMRNASLRFVCRDVWLKVETNDVPFTRGYAPGQVIRVPVAHMDGNYFADEGTLKTLEDHGRVVFRYCDERGNVTPEANPNGSRNNIAGIRNAAGNVLGLMPHPENLTESLLGGTDGRALFESLAEANG